MRISPSVLSCDFAHIASEMQVLDDAGVDMVHVDVMDGVFVPNLSFGAPIIAAMRRHSALPFDVHLMMQYPDRLLDAFIDAGADIVNFHVESAAPIDATLDRILKAGKKAALTIKPNTPAEAVFPYLDRLYMVLVMTVEPGFGGQKFMADQMEKLRALRAKRPELILEVDGGVNRETAPICRENGADVAVAGTAVFRAENIPAEIALLRGE